MNEEIIPLKIPYFDKRFKRTPDIFNNAKLQKIFALFVSNPENYKDIHTLDINDKHDYIFYLFDRFSIKYVDMDESKSPEFDMACYFSSLHIDKAGGVNICGGCDKFTSTRCARKEQLDRYRDLINIKKQKIKFLNEKYGLVFNNLQPDPRLFIGHHDVWLNIGVHLLEKEGYQSVIEKSYDDETFTKPFPSDIDKDLVPLKIRNKVLQKLKKIEYDRIELKKIRQAKKIQAEEDELENQHILKVPLFPKLPSPTSIVSVAIDDEDW